MKTEGITISLSKEKTEEFFFNALCNAVGTGYIRSSGIELDWNEQEYKDAKKSLVEQKKNTCLEDVWMEMLRKGCKLKIHDFENEEYNREIILNDVHEKMSKVPIHHLTDMIEENDDAATADAIIQTVFFGEIIF